MIVFVSVGGKEYAAGGYPPSQGGSALSHRERDEDVHGHDRVPAHGGGKLPAQQHAGRAPAGRRSGAGDHGPAPARSPLGTRERHGLPGGSRRRNGRPRPVRSTACALRPPSRVPARQPGALFEHELPRARSRDREVTGRSCTRSSNTSSTRSVSRGRSCRRRAASLISTTPATTRTFPGRRARSSRTRTSPASTPSSRGE